MLMAFNENVIKNLSVKLDNNWTLFIKDFYKCLEKTDISEFLSQQDILKTSYLSASTYLLRIEKIKEKWAAYFNYNTFMADMITTQHDKLMNNLIKGYLDASTSLITFITAFELALDAQNENIKFRIYQ